MEMGAEIIRNGSSKHQKCALVCKENPGTDETHHNRSMCKENIRKRVRKASEMGRQNIRNGLWSGGKLQVRMKRTNIEACAREASGNG
jgi:hypothetical protein